MAHSKTTPLQTLLQVCSRPRTRLCCLSLLTGHVLIPSSRVQASAGLGVFSLAYWSLFRDKPKEQIHDSGPPNAQQQDIVTLLDQESQKSSNKYWQGELEGQDSNKA